MSTFHLVINTTEREHAVALFDGNDLSFCDDTQSAALRQTGESPESSPPGASSMLLPMIDRGLKLIGATAKKIDLITVARGPGGFTGLRVGIVAAKTLAFCNNAAIVALDTLESCAEHSARRHQLTPETEIHSIINAQRQQLFYSRWRVAGDGQADAAILIEESCGSLLGRDAWCESISDHVFVTGPGVPLVREALEKRNLSHGSSNRSISIESADSCSCDVIAMAAQGRAKFDAGRTTDFWKLSPVYFRPSAAEEKRADAG